jgi:hypothetical protein
MTHPTPEIIEATEVRQIQVREHVGPRFCCTHCGTTVLDGLGFMAWIVEPRELIEVDGVFCSEECCEEEAQSVTISDAHSTQPIGDGQ